MKRLLVLAFMVTVLSAHSAAAQEATDSARTGGLETIESVIAESGVAAALDSIAVTTAPDLQDALEELATTLGVIAGRIANDPELRASALLAAGGVVEIAQVVVAEQSDTILAVLRDAARQIAVESPVYNEAID